MAAYHSIQSVFDDEKMGYHMDQEAANDKRHPSLKRRVKEQRIKKSKLTLDILCVDVSQFHIHKKELGLSVAVYVEEHKFEFQCDEGKVDDSKWGFSGSCHIEVDDRNLVKFEILEKQPSTIVGSNKTFLYYFGRGNSTTLELHGERGNSSLEIKVTEGHIQRDNLQHPVGSKSLALLEPSIGFASEGGVFGFGSPRAGALGFGGFQSPKKPKNLNNSPKSPVDDRLQYQDVHAAKRRDIKSKFAKNAEEFKLDDSHYFWPAMDTKLAQKTVGHWGHIRCLVHRSPFPESKFYLTYCEMPVGAKDPRRFVQTIPVEAKEEEGIYRVDLSYFIGGLKKAKVGGRIVGGRGGRGGYQELNEFIDERGWNRIEPLTNDLLDKLDDCGFWVGSMSRGEAMSLQEENYSIYLVRLSDNAHGLVLSVLVEPDRNRRSASSHHIIERNAKGFRMLGSNGAFFEDLHELLVHWQYNSRIGKSHPDLIAYERPGFENPDRGEYYGSCYEKFDAFANK